MPRKTKEEKLAEQAAAHAEFMISLAKSYPARLMRALELAQKFDMKIRISDVVFSVEPYESTGYGAFEMDYEFGSDSEIELQRLEGALLVLQEERDEEVRVYQAKKAALAKLTDEERKLLNL
jgi:hypothetical protein